MPGFIIKIKFQHFQLLQQI